MILGTGPGQHRLFQCPKAAELTSPEQREKEAAKQRKEDEKFWYEHNLKGRRQIAKTNIQNNKFPHLPRVKMTTCRGKRSCPVCDFAFDCTVLPDHPNWHSFKSRRCEYCPWADDPSVKQELIARSKGRLNARIKRKRALFEAEATK